MEKHFKKGSKRRKFSSTIYLFPLMLFLFMLCFTQNAISQQTTAVTNMSHMKEITGFVKTSDGEAVIGASVIEKLTKTNGTITDIDGSFKLKVPTNSSIVVTYLGYETQEVLINNQTSLEIVLEEAFREIDEVVVIGYGTVKKKDLTGAVGTVSGDVLTQTKNMSLSNALQGAVPGLLVTRSNGLAAADVKVRGITTIGDSSPLIIVDGSPVSDMNFVNPNDIENISVLKDAASASIYGARAASGVILINTKRAKDNMFDLKYSTEYGLEKVTTHPKYASAIRYMEATNEKNWNDANNVAGSEYSTYAQDVVENYLNLNAENPDLYPITDWWDLVMSDNAPRQKHYLDITGGTKNIRTKISLGYDKVEGLFANKTQDRFTFRANNNLTINKYLSSTFDVSFRRASNTSPNQDPFPSTGSITNMAPIYPVFWKNGGYAANDGSSNVYAQLMEGGVSKNLNNQLAGKISLTLTPLEGLSFTGLFSSNLTFFKGKTFTKKVGYYSADDPELFVNYFTGWAETKLSESRNDTYNYTTQLFGNYEKSINDAHNFNLMAGFESYKYFTERLSTGRGYFDLDDFPYLDLGSAEHLTNGGNAAENAYQSYFSRIMYNYMNKYLLQVNVRRDASSRFHSEYRWGTFPSVSAGWVISEESFYKAKDWMPYLKLRASWGTLGNERIGNNYPYQSTIRYTTIILNNADGPTAVKAAVQNGIAIKDITWETTESKDVGFDAYFLDNRLRLSGDYYKKETKDMLLALEIPDYVGYDNPDKNTGSMHTSGFEIEAGWNDVIGNWKYGVSVNLSDFVSKMGNLDGTEFLGNKVKKEGSEFNEWYGYLSDGLYQTQEQVDTYPKLNDNTQMGDVIYKDISGPDGVPDGKISPEYDRVLLGGSLPRFMFGGNLFLGYKNIDLTLVFQGVGKQNALLTTDMVQPFINNRGNVPNVIDGKYWSHYKTAEENVGAEYPRLSNTNAAGNYAMSDYWLFNGRYLRIKAITLAYTIPANITKTVGIKSLRIHASVNDLPAFSNYPKGWDPEMTGFAYPITSSYIIGASVNF